MDDATAQAPLDPTTASPRALMQALLPAARAEYIKAWELLADPSTALERRRVARARAAKIADDHAVVVEFLRGREAALSGDDLLNARHLASELDRHVEALQRIAKLSAVGLAGTKDLRPESLGCGKRYRDPARNAEVSAATRSVSNQPKAKPRGGRDQARGGDRPFNDRGPKVARDALGTSKHDSSLGDDLDEETRAKLEAIRQSLSSSD